MIRFLPDTLMELILRPWYMMLPGSGVYVEFTAPDVRVLAVCLLSPFVLYGLKKRGGVEKDRCAAAAIVVFFLALLIWVTTTGNGRYFMPFMVFVGPLLVALVARLSLSRAMRAFILLLLLCVQAGLVLVNSPWNPSNSLELTAWSDGPSFSVDVEALKSDEEVTYVTIMEQSYSIVAPILGGRARWINLRYFEGYDFFGSSFLLSDARRRLSEAKDLRLLVRSFPQASNIENGLPNADALAFLNSYLRPYGLIVKPGGACRVIRSDTVASAELASFSRDVQRTVQEKVRYSGFWTCPMIFVGRGGGDDIGKLRSSPGARLIEKMERICPKYFPAGQVMFRREGDGLVRYYPSTDVKLIYAEASGKLLAKFTFVLNPVFLGDLESVSSESFVYDCRRFVRRESF